MHKHTETEDESGFVREGPILPKPRAMKCGTDADNILNLPFKGSADVSNSLMVYIAQVFPNVIPNLKEPSRHFKESY
jgi:hypothetical protein